MSFLFPFFRVCKQKRSKKQP